MGAESFQHGFGVGVNVLSALESLRSPGGLGRYLQGETLARENPNVRASLVGSPFSAGLLGVSGSRQPLSLGPGGTGPSAPQQVWQPNLPPLSPEEQAKQAGAQLDVQDIQSLQGMTPDVQQQARYHRLGIQLPAGPAPEGFQILRIGPTGPVYGRTPPATPNIMDVPGHPGMVYQPQTGKFANAPKPIGAEARARVGAQSDANAQALGFKGASDPAYKAWLRSQVGLGAPGGTPAPTPTPIPPVAPPEGAVPGNTPVGQLPMADDRIGYPPPAFLEGDTTPTPTGAPVVNPAAPAAPPPTPGAIPQPGITRSLKAGPITIRQQGPPAQGKAVPAATASRLSGEASASQAARQALAMLQQGPQAPFTIGGYPVGTPPHFAGPLSGRALGALTSVSGQPLAVEEAQLAALVAHAKTGVFGITGLRPNQETLAMFDPLMPNLNQPTEILRAHLERLSGFYDMLTQMQGVLSNLSEDQKRALVYDLFRQHMTTPGPNGAPAPVIDVRQPGAR